MIDDTMINDTNGRMRKMKLKVCGMREAENIAEVAALQPDYMGFIFYPASKRYVADLDPDVLHNLSAEIQKTGVFVNESLEQVLALQKKYALDAIQLHGAESPDYCLSLKKELKNRQTPGKHTAITDVAITDVAIKDMTIAEVAANNEVVVIKAFGIHDDFDFGQLEAYEGLIDFFLFDTKTPDHGGSGKKFEWKLLDKYRLSLPYFLSGGLDLESAAALLEIDDPRLAVIDVNSKFETAPGIKDRIKLKAFKSRLDHNRLQG